MILKQIVEVVLKRQPLFIIAGLVIKASIG